MNALIKKLTPEESAAELSALSCCPVCGEKLVTVAHSHECDEYCPTCAGLGVFTVCPNAPHRGG